MLGIKLGSPRLRQTSIYRLSFCDNTLLLWECYCGLLVEATKGLCLFRLLEGSLAWEEHSQASDSSGLLQVMGTFQYDGIQLDFTVWISVHRLGYLAGSDNTEAISGECSQYAITLRPQYSISIRLITILLDLHRHKISKRVFSLFGFGL